MRPAPDIMPPPAAAPAAKEIPYDYVAKFTLLGKRGNRVQDVINISIEGAFVAVAIGYSFIPAKLRTRYNAGLTGEQPIRAATSIRSCEHNYRL